MKTDPFTTEELHTRIRKQLGLTQAETGKEHFPHDVCPHCGAESLPAEKVPDQVLRGCLVCDHVWFEDLSKPPSIQAETGDHVEQHGAAESFSDWLREKGDDLADEDRWSLRDDGRSGGWCDSESYSERNH